MTEHTEEYRACPECGFQLWNPITHLSASDVGFYDDARFPGRMIVALREHHEHLDLLPGTLGLVFMQDIKWCSSILREHVGATRVNVTVFGNKEPHVHAHVIPRFGEDEPLPGESPWLDPRQKTKLPDFQREVMVSLLKEGFAAK